jgi:hypothetical protein
MQSKSGDKNSSSSSFSSSSFAAVAVAVAAAEDDYVTSSIQEHGMKFLRLPLCNCSSFLSLIS